MDAMPWLGPLKQFVLVWFFLIFSGIWLWTYSRGNRGLEDLRNLPFEEGEIGEVHGRG